MHKFISLLLVLGILAGALAGCSGNTPQTAGTGNSIPAEGTTQRTEPSEAMTEPAEETTAATEQTEPPVTETTAATEETEPPTEPEKPKPTQPKPTEPVPPESTQPTVPPVEPTTPSTQPETQPTTPPPVNSREPVLQPPDTQTVSGSFFDDAVFVGDSISLKLAGYAGSTGLLGNAKFLTVGSLGVYNAINDHPDTRVTYQGVRYTNLEEAIAATGAGKVFIMFGMNDIGRVGVDSTISNWATLLGLIRGACGDVTIYIQSMTPVWTGGERGKLNNANVLKYNQKLESFAAANGCRFIDIHPYMVDSTGGLATRYCSDKYVHLTNAGAKTWIAVLKAYTGY